MAHGDISYVAKYTGRRDGIFGRLFASQVAVPVRDRCYQLCFIPWRLTSVESFRRRGFMNDGTKHVRGTNSDNVESAGALASGPRQKTATHVELCSLTKSQAARSASVLLALYQCIRQASVPFSPTSSIDCRFQSDSVKVAVPGSLFSRMLRRL